MKFPFAKESRRKLALEYPYTEEDLKGFKDLTQKLIADRFFRGPNKPVSINLLRQSISSLPCPEPGVAREQIMTRGLGVYDTREQMEKDRDSVRLWDDKDHYLDEVVKPMATAFKRQQFKNGEAWVMKRTIVEFVESNLDEIQRGNKVFKLLQIVHDLKCKQVPSPSSSMFFPNDASSLDQ